MTSIIYVRMRYDREHKARTHERIVKSASRQFRAEGLTGPGVINVMKASGLTHGGFYKHFKSKDDLLVEAVDQSVHEIGTQLIEWARQSKPGDAWKELVKKYLSIEHCEHAESGCPMAALAPDIARTPPSVRRKIRASMERYRKQVAEFMPGENAAAREKNFILIFTAMVGAMSVARTMSDVEDKQRVLALVRNHLLASF
jgi:TetR/AcrR family transcriptional regulator, transcriptional repressor for nem operon